MPGKYRKKRRERIVSLFSFLPIDKQRAVDHWLRGRKQAREIRDADFVFISAPKSGRTWLRVMLSGFFQSHHGIPAGEILGYDNFHRINPAIPRIRFTDDRYVSNYTGNHDSKCDYYDKKVLILTRDPRDIAVSNYHQWKNTVNPYKIRLHKLPPDTSKVGLFEYVMNEDYGIPRTVCFYNLWQTELDKTRDHLLVRYEDMQADSAGTLRHILTFINCDASDADIGHALEYSSLENMRKIEAGNDPLSGSRRLMPKDLSNPESFKARRGKVGGYRDYFSDNELSQIEAYISANLSPAFGYTQVPTLNAKPPETSPDPAGSSQ